MMVVAAFFWQSMYQHTVANAALWYYVCLPLKTITGQATRILTYYLTTS